MAAAFMKALQRIKRLVANHAPPFLQGFKKRESFTPMSRRQIRREEYVRIRTRRHISVRMSQCEIDTKFPPPSRLDSAVLFWIFRAEVFHISHNGARRNISDRTF